MNGHYGIETSQANTLIGGTTVSARNVVSGNGYSGIVLWKSTANLAVVQNNYVGTDVTGTKDLGNYWRGIDVSNGASNARIESNLVSGNDMDGIMLYQGSSNLIKNNIIGFNATKTAALKNFANGIRFTSVTSATATGNYIGNNDGYALFRTGGGTITLSGNTIKNNEIFNLTV
ncbi:MAG: right-handed parallel beta-helix repeat-containing protein [Tepidisphaeraceae bacterium]